MKTTAKVLKYITQEDERTKKKKFFELLRRSNRPSIEEVLTELENIGFFEAPASRKDHLAYQGGLFQHSLNVYTMSMTLYNQLKALKPDLEIQEESIIIASLLHDVCKADRYTMTDNGTYVKNYNLPIGHGEKSVIMLLKWGLELTNEEMLAIRWHMGGWHVPNNEEQQTDYVHAVESCPLVTLIHTADTLASKIVEIEKETASIQKINS